MNHCLDLVRIYKFDPKSDKLPKNSSVCHCFHCLSSRQIHQILNSPRVYIPQKVGGRLKTTFKIAVSVCADTDINHQPLKLPFSLYYTPWRSHSCKFETFLTSSRTRPTGKNHSPPFRSHGVNMRGLARTTGSSTLAHVHLQILPTPSDLTWAREISAFHTWSAFRISSSRSRSAAMRNAVLRPSRPPHADGRSDVKWKHTRSTT